jgi:hypothetical protein
MLKSLLSLPAVASLCRDEKMHIDGKILVPWLPLAVLLGWLGRHVDEAQRHTALLPLL